MSEPATSRSDEHRSTGAAHAPLLACFAVMVLAEAAAFATGRSAPGVGSGAWMALADLGAAPGWSEGALWPLLAGVARHLPALSPPHAALGLLNRLLLGPVACLATLFCLEALTGLRSPAPGAPRHVEPVDVVLSAAAGLVLAISPLLMRAADSCGPWMLGYALSFLALWQLSRALRLWHLTGGRALATGAAVGLAAACGSCHAIALLGCLLPALWRWLTVWERRDAEWPRPAGALSLSRACLGLGLGLLPVGAALLSRGSPSETGLLGTARALVALPAWNVGVDAAPYAVRSAGAVLFSALSPLALFLGGGLLLTLAVVAKARAPRTSRTVAQFAAIWPPLMLFCVVWAPAWSTTGADAPLTLVPCALALVAITLCGFVWAESQLPAGRVRPWRSVLQAVALALVCMPLALTPIGIRMGSPLSPAPSEVEARSWATGLLEGVPEGTVVVLDDDLGPRADLAGALLRARLAEGRPWPVTLVVSPDPVGDETWGRLTPMLGLAPALAGREERWQALYAADRPVLCSSWREPLDAGLPLRCSFGLFASACGGGLPDDAPAAEAGPSTVERGLLSVRLREDVLGPADAEKALLSALREAPISRTVWSEWSRCLALEGRASEARAAWRVARELDRRAVGMAGWQEREAGSGVGLPSRLLGFGRRILRLGR